ncbi:hypothetical protein ACFWPX_29785 [Nocardia sp. NPDC058518]|uniref:hypothetical protein n=1 Tax=Nocardia sp. NPDC058518 TaxID=3346534 RepID=UPI0036493CC6
MSAPSAFDAEGDDPAATELARITALVEGLGGEHKRERGQAGSTFDDDPAVVELEQVLARVRGLTGEHAREWEQFATWGIAHGLPVLPAPASVLLDYLAAYPGTLATQRGRVSAIAAAHRRARRAPGDPLPIVAGSPPRVGVPSPGDAEAVRRILRPAEHSRTGTRARPGRAQRLACARAELEPVIAHLPVTGWPHALVGRRDALVLHLITAGLAFDTIAALRQRDVRIHDAVVVVGTQPLVELPATGLPTTCPVTVMRRWATVLAYAPRPTGHIDLERLLTGTAEDEPVTGLLPRWAELPLLCRFDERGFADGYIDELAPLTRTEIIDIFTSRRAFDMPSEIVELSADWHERGVAARHRDHATSQDLDDLLTRLEDMLDDVGEYDDWTEE